MKYHLRKLTTLLLLLILGVSYTYAYTAYTVVIKAEKFGSVEPSGEQTIGSEPVQIIATANEGYEFSSWSATGGAAVSSITQATTNVTATADGIVTAYFKEKLYSIAIKSNNTDAGRVSHPSTSVGQINASSEIVATANPGYRFVEWTATEGIRILSPESPTTRITATKGGTLTAIFEATTEMEIYFRPNKYWTKGDGAKYGVKYWNGSESAWIEMQQVTNNTDYYSVTIPRAATELAFGRFDPQTQTSNFADATPWNQTGNLSIPTDGKNLFDLRLHLKPSADARYVAYFYRPTQDDINGVFDWVEMTDTDGDGIHECDIPNQKNKSEDGTDYYTKVMFCQMKEGTTENNWSNVYSSTEELSCNALYPAPELPKNLYTLETNEWSTYWETYDAPTYPVTLNASKFGEYGFVHKDIQYFSPISGSVTYNIPKGDTVKLFSTPYNKAYSGDIMIRQGNVRSEIVPEAGDPTLVISSATVLEDNYKTKGTHIVYLGVPQDASWANAEGKQYLSAFHKRSETVKCVEMNKVGTADRHDYYRCEIPYGVNTIRFEKRAEPTTFASTDRKSIDLVYDIPLSSINCYTLGGMKQQIDENGQPVFNGGSPVGDPHQYDGLWDVAPGFGNDYRLVNLTGKKDAQGRDIVYHSDIIREGVTEQTVSLHINPNGADGNYPKIALRKHNDGNWQDVESILVRDMPAIAEPGVWNFIVTPGAEEGERIYCEGPYVGDYYIRTNNAEGGWRNYTLSTNKMTRSSYEGSGYTHYFCRWIDVQGESKIPGQNKNVKFIVANDYGAVISSELAKDDFTADGGILVDGTKVNVRWSWNETTNEVKRAYIQDKSQEKYPNDDVIATYTNGDSKTIPLLEQKNWIYEADIKGVKPGATLNNITALYNSRTQNFIEGQDIQNKAMITGEGENSYTVRVMYDFKTNKTTAMLIPDANQVAVGIDVLLDRTNQDGATQVRSNITKTEGFNVYATLTLGKEHLEDLSKTEWKRLYYWISFPFDVRLSDVFGFGVYGKHWIIEYYDGKGRAENGYYIDGPSYWRYVSDPTKTTLKANTGYVLALNMGIANMGIFNEGNDFVRLYFPSKDKITSIDGNMQKVTVTLEEYKCSIEEDNRKFYDSNWHMIGAPSYANQDLTLTQSDLFFYYTYNTDDNTYQVTSAGENVTFKSLHSYMVQYAGNITWNPWTLTPPSSVSRKNTDSKQDNYSLRLALMAGEKMADQTFVQLKAEGATADYDMNMDLTKLLSNGTNIYTLAGEDKIQLAGSVMPTEKANIPVGVKISAAGEYTFRMPDGTDGISAILIDNETGTHTNLLLNNYTINLNAGTYENRFYLAVDPDCVNTSLEDINGAMKAHSETAQKYIINGELIIKTANGIYDAIGKRK